MHELDMFMHQIMVSHNNSMHPYVRVRYEKIRYVRYAGDFVIGIAGPRKLALEIEANVRDFLKEKL